MTSKKIELEKMAALAYLDIHTENASQLSNDVANIMSYIEQLRTIDTSNVQPMTHPLQINQRLRSDIVTEANHKNELNTIAPLFSDGLFLVPKVIDTGK